jgi:dTDP-glucose pyrophosphorylase
MVHAGDDLIVSKNKNHLTKLVNTFTMYDADAAFYVERVNDPTRYGVMSGKEVGQRVYKVESVIEKPLVPPSNLAIVAIYILTPAIFQAIEETQPDQNGETQLTDAIMSLIHQKRSVYAVELNQSDKRIDVGTPESYWKALAITCDVGCLEPEAD